MDVEAIAKKLTPAQRDAVLEFARQNEEYLIAEDAGEAILIRDLRNIGLVNELHVNGTCMMSLREPGLAVRDYLIKEGK